MESILQHRRPHDSGASRQPDDDLRDLEQVSLCEALDRILNKGAVIVGEVMITVADIDLIYLSLQVIVASVETARKEKGLAQ